MNLVTLAGMPRHATILAAPVIIRSTVIVPISAVVITRATTAKVAAINRFVVIPWRKMYEAPLATWTAAAVWSLVMTGSPQVLVGNFSAGR